MERRFKDYKEFEYAFLNRGETLEGSKMTFRDMISTPEASEFLPQVLTNAIAEAVDPLLVLTKLFSPIEYKEGIVIGGRAVGAIDMNFDVPEGGEYQAITVTMAPGIKAAIKPQKRGAKVVFTDEAERADSFDLIRRTVVETGKGMARWKERQASALLSNLGTALFDNMNPTQSTYGVTTGRGLDGSANATLTPEDLLKAIVAIQLNGFTPNLLICHPLLFMNFLIDPIMQSLFVNTGKGSLFGSWTGQLSVQEPWEDPLRGLGPSSGRSVTPPGARASLTPSEAKEYSQRQTSAPVIPSHWFGAPLTIVVSPLIRYDNARNVTDVIIADRDSLGYYIEAFKLKVERWRNNEVDLNNIKLSESYTFAIANEGMGVGVIKNLKVDVSRVHTVLQPTISGLNAIPSETALVT